MGKPQPPPKRRHFNVGKPVPTRVVTAPTDVAPQNEGVTFFDEAGADSAPAGTGAASAGGVQTPTTPTANAATPVPQVPTTTQVTSAVPAPTAGVQAPPDLPAATPDTHLVEVKNVVVEFHDAARSIYIGTKPEAPGREIVISGRDVFQKHAAIDRFADGSYYLWNANSSQVTIVRGTKMAPNDFAEIKDGEIVQFGGCKFKLEIKGPQPTELDALATDVEADRVAKAAAPAPAVATLRPRPLPPPPPTLGGRGHGRAMAD